MNTNVVKKNKLAIAVLAASVALSMTQTVSAAGDSLQDEAESTGTYWGVGIGSVIGAVIAGPPGAALGATLGGSIGWGQGKDTELDKTLIDLGNKAQVLERNHDALVLSEKKLKQHRTNLDKAQRKVTELRRSNALQSARLSDIELQDGRYAQGNDILQGVIEHYAQEVYYRNGQSDLPDYAESRLSSLTEFLNLHPKLQVILKGYTDHRGAPEFNEALAQDRVDGIRSALLDQGVDAQRITAQAVGEVGSPAGDSGNYVLNRRVSIELSIHEPEILTVSEPDGQFISQSKDLSISESKEPSIGESKIQPIASIVEVSQ